jgi:hypothetical protein
MEIAADRLGAKVGIARLHQVVDGDASFLHRRQLNQNRDAKRIPTFVSDVIARLFDPRLPSAIGTAIKRPVCLDSVSDDLTAAVIANRR